MKNDELKYTSDIAFTPSVKAIQEKFHSRSSYARMEQFGGWQSEVAEELTQFLNNMDSFYLSTSNALGQPYTQHRGGPKGFLKTIDNKTLAFADFSGNRQYITAGNLSVNEKAFIFLMDYPNKTRIKIWGTAKVVEDDKELLESLSDPSYKARLERAIVFTVEAWDVNCRQHIQQRFTQEDIKTITDPLNRKITELEDII
ncbi:MAG: pyridoxamine 5'-phosphate oxidase [Bacteroidetes bacterium]|nr:MAG: pyridoxamine 5'-phosphate oxidase [Bacteroidota bacterium]